MQSLLFTGITEGTGRVKSISKPNVKNNQPRYRIKLRVSLGKLSRGLKVGKSLSIDGACLTITRLHAGTADFELVEETTKRTSLGCLKAGDLVNIERSLQVGDRLEGHIVLGHVDAIGRIEQINKSSGQTKLWIRINDKQLMSSIVSKGSIAINGTSLTVVDVVNDSVSLVLIPHTLAVTTLGRKSIGDVVNVETDIIAKYVSNNLPKN